MVTLTETLRLLSAKHKERIDKAKKSVENIKRAAEAARQVSREIKSGKG